MMKVLRKMDKKINIFKYTIESQHAAWIYRYIKAVRILWQFHVNKCRTRKSRPAVSQACIKRSQRICEINQSHVLVTPLVANRVHSLWRQLLNITRIYLGRSQPRIIHSRAPAADGEGRCGAYRDIVLSFA